MNKEIFILKLQTYQTSSAPVDVKEKAIQKLKYEFYGSNNQERNKQILNEIYASAADLKYSELN